MILLLYYGFLFFGVLSIIRYIQVNLDSVQRAYDRCQENKTECLLYRVEWEAIVPILCVLFSIVNYWRPSPWYAKFHFVFLWFLAGEVFSFLFFEFVCNDIPRRINRKKDSSQQ